MIFSIAWHGRDWNRAKLESSRLPFHSGSSHEPCTQGGLERSDKLWRQGLAPSTRVEPVASGARRSDQQKYTQSGLERSDKIIRAVERSWVQYASRAVQGQSKR